MRLFIAIGFQEKTIASLRASADALRARGITGNYSRPENLHLTVIFIGETTRIREAVSALEGLRAGPFPLELGGLGSFRGGVLWCGIRQNPPLLDVYSQLSASLQKAGFRLEERPYSPHLTICREAVLPPGLSIKSLSPLFPDLQESVSRISLMKSERIDGKLIYTEIHTKALLE